MHNDETIAQIFSRFTTITNDLNTLGNLYTSIEFVNKILRNLPKAYQSKVLAIREARDLSKLPLVIPPLVQRALVGIVFIRDLMDLVGAVKTYLRGQIVKVMPLSRGLGWAVR